MVISLKRGVGQIIAMPASPAASIFSDFCLSCFIRLHFPPTLLQIESDAYDNGEPDLCLVFFFSFSNHLFVYLLSMCSLLGKEVYPENVFMFRIVC